MNHPVSTITEHNHMPYPERMKRHFISPAIKETAVLSKEPPRSISLNTHDKFLPNDEEAAILIRHKNMRQAIQRARKKNDPSCMKDPTKLDEIDITDIYE
jgi:hypothetical protein